MSNDADVSAEPPRALLHDVVLQNIFDYLGFKTLKNCRMVCRKWKSTCDSGFRKRAKVCPIHNLSFPLVHHRFKDFKEIFFRDGSEFPYSSLSLVGQLNWRTSKLRRFFLNEGRSITELEVKDLILVEGRLQPLTKIDLTTFITPNLKRLIINKVNIEHRPLEQEFRPTPIFLNTRALPSLDYLYLSDCRITLADNFQMSAKEITLDVRNRYYRNETEMLPSDTSLWRFINLQRLEKLTFKDDSLTLDLRGTKSLNSLTLHANTNVEHWQTSEWHIDKLVILKQFEFERTRMTITELEVWESDIRFSVLPTTIKKLVLVRCGTGALGPGNVDLPLLNCLVLRENIYDDFISCFKYCNNLTEIALYCKPGLRGVKLKVYNLPNNVNKLLLDIDFPITGRRVSPLDTLVLSNYSPSNMDGSELSQLPAKHLIYLNIKQQYKFDDDYVRKIFQVSKYKFCGSVTVGPFGWDRASRDNLAESSLCQPLGESEFYTSEAEQVRAIGGFLVRENIRSLLAENVN